MLTLAVNARDSKESAETLRNRGFIPAIFYGPKEASTSIAVDVKQFERIFREAGETTIITLKGMDSDKETLVRDVQIHPVTDKPLHVDFYVLEKGKKIEIKIPLEFTGVAPAEKAGHIVVKALHEVEIEVAPAELPKHLEVDISKLENVGDHIVAAQIKLPPSAVLKTNGEEIVASVTAFVEEKIEAPAPVEGAATPATEGAAAPAADAKGGDAEGKKE